MSQYKTEQKKAIFNFLAAHSEQAFTMDEIVEALQSDASLPAAPGKSTVYRIIPSLVEEGRVKRFVEGTSRHFRYQLVNKEHCDSHLHMKCLECGKLYHMEDGESEEIIHQIMEKHGFSVNEQNTVLMGCCENCHMSDKND